MDRVEPLLMSQLRYAEQVIQSQLFAALAAPNARIECQRTHLTMNVTAVSCPPLILHALTHATTHTALSSSMSDSSALPTSLIA